MRTTEPRCGICAYRCQRYCMRLRRMVLRWFKACPEYKESIHAND